jgi:uncharacterized protein (DUF2141 family)
MQNLRSPGAAGDTLVSSGRLLLAIARVPEHATGMPNGRLRVEVQRLRNDRGHLLAGVYDDPRGFPREGKPTRHGKTEIHEGQAVIEFEGLPPGEYAIAVLHDENDDGKMNVNRLKIPTEGFGMTNFPKLKLSPPSFDEAKFEYSGDDQTVEVTIHYLL